jgi:hypothetical protein
VHLIDPSRHDAFISISSSWSRRQFDCFGTITFYGLVRCWMVLVELTHSSAPPVSPCNRT